MAVITEKSFTLLYVGLLGTLKENNFDKIKVVEFNYVFKKNDKKVVFSRSYARFYVGQNLIIEGSIEEVMTSIESKVLDFLG